MARRRRLRPFAVRPIAVLAAGLLAMSACSSTESPSAASSTAAPSTGSTTPTTPTTAPTPTSTGDATSATGTGAPSTEQAPTDGPATTPPTTAPPDTTATTAPVETTATTAADLSAAEIADMALARTALITLDDFPDGWTEDPDDADEDDPDNAAFEAEFDECLGRDDDDRVGDDLEELVVSTGDFHPVDQNAPTVAHEVVLAPDEATAVAAMTEVVIDGAESCLADVIRRFYVVTFADDPDLAGIAIGDVVVTRTETERPDDLAVGVLMEIPLTLDGQDISQFLEILYLRQGRALSELSFSSFGEPFSRDGYTILGDEVVTSLAAVG